MLNSLMHAPLSFFELTPTGRLVASTLFLIQIHVLYRILNLFSRDTYVVDQILPRVIESLCRTFAVSLSIIVVIGSSFPPFLIIVLPLGWLYLRIMRFVDVFDNARVFLMSMNADITLLPHENWSDLMLSLALPSLPGSRNRCQAYQLFALSASNLFSLRLIRNGLTTIKSVTFQVYQWTDGSLYD